MVEAHGDNSAKSGGAHDPENVNGSGNQGGSTGLNKQESISSALNQIDNEEARHNEEL